MNADERRAWLFPPAAGHFHGIDLARLDTNDEDERRILIEAEHPDLADALDKGLDEIVSDGRTINPRLHIAMHSLAVHQLLHDDPPEMWPTVERLVDAGYDRHDVLHMLGSVAAEELWHMQHEHEPFDRARHAGALDALPGSWSEDDGDEVPYDDDEHDDARLPDGTVLTHRLTAEEAVGGFVVYSPDLEPLLWFADHGHLHLATGEVAERELVDGIGVLTGPTGWLRGAGPGDLVGFRIMGDEVEVSPSIATPALGGMRERLRAAFDDLNSGDGMPVPVGELLGEALLATSGTPTTLLPVSELLPACGFEYRAGFAGLEGVDWDMFGRIQSVAVVAMMHGLRREAAAALVLLSALYHDVVAGDLRLEDQLDVVAETATLLTDASLARAFVDMARPMSDDTDLDAFLDGLLRGAARRDRGAVLWTMSILATALGDHRRAEALLGQALDADPDHWEALVDAAWYASDRGDARRAVALLGQLQGAGDEDIDRRAAVLQRYARPSIALAGRNDPCPCGSGRKYKQCCMRVPGVIPLSDRTPWIWEKLAWFLDQAGFDDELDELLDTLGGDDPHHEFVAISLLLFVDGVVDEFLVARGPLLPDDERDLIAQWALVDHSVHEVVGVRPGVVTTRDIRTGDVVDARERLGSAHLAAGDLLLAQVVPDSEGHQIAGGALHVSLRMRDPLIALLDDEADAVELAGFLARMAAPPEMVTMEGEPIALCTAHYAIGEPVARGSLDDVLHREDASTWSESVTVDERSWVRGTVAVDGDELVVSANSEVRFRRLCSLVESAVPGLELMREETKPATDLMAAGGAADPPPPPTVPVEAAGALAEFMREQEDRWLEEQIPALKGLTPRQAAADPTRREELEALLREFDRMQPPPGALTFDTSRLRSLLGLPGR